MNTSTSLSVPRFDSLMDTSRRGPAYRFLRGRRGPSQPPPGSVAGRATTNRAPPCLESSTETEPP